MFLDENISYSRLSIHGSQLGLYYISSKILLQTWEVASQQCESYGWEESFTVISMGWFPDLGDKLGDKVGDEIWDLRGAGIFSISLLGEEIRLNVLDDSM
ncbi:hypothetical protein AVEN_427-1 [Araneus ventricosus]|uniref:Uncharacterized protein n=1 Tax=Araneus ventricosus TaxID=182803 RepID=A0A4Y2Q045_ARAVE|nr:hypothetical protein AVEN_427-1 [Araneus ventricosus]